jgi:hypothetical protein
MHGQFLLVQLETQDEAVLGRITSLSSSGKLSLELEKNLISELFVKGGPIPEDLREQYLKYEVDIRVLGVLRKDLNGGLTFVASQRRLPHVGSPVAFLADNLLQDIANHNIVGAEIGTPCIRRVCLCRGSDKIDHLDWMQIKSLKYWSSFPLRI